MVWRDLDVSVVCRKLEAATVARLGAGLAIHPECEKCFSATTQGVGTSIPSPRTAAISACIIEPAPGTTGRSTWFADEPERQRDLAHARSLPPRLTPTTRAAILRIKDTRCKRPEYGKAVRSYDIYPAVLDGYPRTLEQFAQWLQRRTG